METVWDIIMIGDLMVTSGWYHGGHGCGGGAIIDAWMRLAYVEIYSFKLQNPQWFFNVVELLLSAHKIGD